MGRPAGDADARANAAIQQGLQNCGDIYKSSQIGSPAPDGAGPGGPGQQYPDKAYGRGGFGQQSPDGGVGAPLTSAGSLEGAGGAGEKPNFLARMIGTADGTGTADKITGGAGEKPNFLVRMIGTADGTGTST
jgi:hypothetical protein